MPNRFNTCSLEELMVTQRGWNPFPWQFTTVAGEVTGCVSMNVASLWTFVKGY